MKQPWEMTQLEYKENMRNITYVPFPPTEEEFTKDKITQNF